MNPPPEPGDRPSPPGELHGLDPAELLARGLMSARAAAAAMSWTPPPLEEIRKMLPEFEVERLIARGGMGAVYQCRQPALEREVAVKLLPAEMAADGQFVERFRREARMLAKLQHPGIVAVHAYGQTEAGHLYFVMEHVDGYDLHHLVHHIGLSPAQAIAMTIQICDALHYAHDQGVVHRDIKPANVLVTRDGRAKLADFGLACALWEESRAPRLTGAHELLGTWGYIAPEQHQGPGDHRADIYALGVLLHEMLTGRPPGGLLDPAALKLPDTARFDQVVLKALQHEPQRRYQNAGEMRSAMEKLQWPGRRPRRRLWTALGLLAVAAGGMIWKGTGGRQPIMPPPPSFYEDTLNRRYLPLPEKPHVLMCIWETRIQDFAQFVEETGHQEPPTDDNGGTTPEKPAPWTWRDPGFPTAPDHPVVAVSWTGATKFCRWLTARERKAGRLLDGQEIRLPTDQEWSAALGVPEEAGDVPVLRRFPDGIFTWSGGWPPKNGVENLLPGVSGDAYPWTSPVGSGGANHLGFHDLGGNVMELCKDRFVPGLPPMTNRGPAYHHGGQPPSSGISRGRSSTDRGSITVGFRCVADLKTPATLERARKLEDRVTAFQRKWPATQRRMIDWLVDGDREMLDLERVDRLEPDQLAWFEGFPVTDLAFAPVGMTHLGILKTMRLRVLALRPNSGDTLEPLRGLRLDWLTCRPEGRSRPDSLDPLRGMPLRGCVLQDFTRLADLSPLQGQPLECLMIPFSRVTDLSPVRQAPMKIMDLDGVPVDDLEYTNWWPGLLELSGPEPLVRRPAFAAMLRGDEAAALQHVREAERLYGQTSWYGRTDYRPRLKELEDRIPLLARWIRGMRTDMGPKIKVFQDHAYLMLDLQMPWEQACGLAEALGGHLVTVGSREEHEFLAREFVTSSRLPTWLGLSGRDQSAEWRWLTGEPLAFQAWNPGAGSAGRRDGMNRAFCNRLTTDGSLLWWHGRERSRNSNFPLIEWDFPNPQDIPGKP